MAAPLNQMATAWSVSNRGATSLGSVYTLVEYSISWARLLICRLGRCVERARGFATRHRPRHLRARRRRGRWVLGGRYRSGDCADSGQRCSDADTSLTTCDDIPANQVISGACSYHPTKIIRELVSNTIKQSTARDAELSLRLDGDTLVLRYSDEGLPPNATQGLGITGLRRR